MPKPAPSAPQERVALFERLLATEAGVERKGAALPYAAINGNMFAILRADGVMGLRLPAQERASFIATHQAQLFESHGAVMKEYVAVPDQLLADTETMRPWMATAWAYAQTLRAKPTKRQTK